MKTKKADADAYLDAAYRAAAVEAALAAVRGGSK